MTDEMSKDQRIAELEAKLDAFRLTRDYFGEQAAENGLRAEAAEATLAKVAALLPAECWVSRSQTVRCTDFIGGHLNGKPEAIFTEEMCCLPCRVRAETQVAATQEALR